VTLVIPGDPAQGVPELRFQANPVYNLYHYLRTLADRPQPPAILPPAQIARLLGARLAVRTPREH